MVDLYSAHCGETPSHRRAGGGEWGVLLRVVCACPTRTAERAAASWGG